MASQISLKELARALGVAPSTVSKALRGHPDIRESTRLRVVEYARKVHYRPNELASGLRNKQLKLLALLVPRLSDCFYAEFVSALLRRAYECRYKVIVLDSGGAHEQEIAMCHDLEKSGVVGVLALSVEEGVNGAHFRTLEEIGIPVVFYDRMTEGADPARIGVAAFNCLLERLQEGAAAR